MVSCQPRHLYIASYLRTYREDGARTGLRGSVLLAVIFLAFGSIVFGVARILLDPYFGFYLLSKHVV